MFPVLSYAQFYLILTKVGIAEISFSTFFNMVKLRFSIFYYYGSNITLGRNFLSTNQVLGILVWLDDLCTSMQSSSGETWTSNRVLWQALCVFHSAVVNLGFIPFIFDDVVDLFIKVHSDSYFMQ